ncbi:protein SDE2 homolog [Momordica charantia]|uniref:Protein SDE2 homolog n=1 Tax=Momordica charantia TaxID=3673 RepID=A0A6J1DMN6_MOMCH|nr:protein SDE2 homolog [Momordica charantia]
MEAQGTPIFNLLVRLLDGKTLALKFKSPSVDAHALKQRLFESTGIPPNRQRLVTGVRQIDEDSVISCSSSSVHLLLRLVGGKGGFGSLLRGAATKAGQKKTNNFDACRDMSGRRLRHVNAEKRLEEWKAEEEERRLEKIAHQFLKNKAKVGKKGVGDSAAQIYVDKYREESARCVAEVEESVRDAVINAANRKRKGGCGLMTANGADPTKFKIWMGKRKLGESDSDGSDEDNTDNEEESKKSVILNSGCKPDLNKDTEGSSDSVSCGKQGDVSGEASCESGSEEEKDMAIQEIMALVGCSSEKAPHSERIDVVEMNNHTTQGADVPCAEAVAISADQEIEAVKQDADEVAIVNSENRQDTSGPNNGETIEDLSTLPEPNGSPVSKLSAPKETAASRCNSEEATLNFDDFSSAAEMEVVGLERLKSELQARGLKCGGTLQERAARLFLLKSTPLDNLPKKLLARK